MSNQLHSDAQAYDKEYDAFIKQLEEFHLQRGTSFKRLPRINGKGIDLYLLYVVVTARGGWQKVNSRNEWEDILEDFRLPAACVNSSVALKHIYIRHLDAYERIHFLGEDGDERAADAEEDEARSLRVKRSVRALNSVPSTYNYQQHIVSDNVRNNSGLSTELYKQSNYDRLSLSLSCPLPNEHDFAFNMCTLLSNEGKHTLQLSQCPRVIEFMLAHTGVFRDRETQKYFISNYKEAKGKSLVQFWIDSIEDKSVLDLLSPECYETADPALLNGQKTPLIKHVENDVTLEVPSPTSPSKSVICEESKGSESADTRNEDERGSKEITVLPQSQTKFNEKDILHKLEQVLASEGVDLKLEPEDTEIFHLGRDLGLLDSEGTRISQVLHILRNLSFEEINIPALAQSNTCLRFLVLCVCSRWGGLAVGALDTLGNIASDVALRDPAVDPASALLLTTICQGVSSQDRAFVLRSLEILNKLAVNDPNEEILSCNIEQSVYDQVCRFLTVHDIMLLIYTLECLYSLSSMGPISCNCIVRAKGSVQTLMSLLTVEAQSYGPEACIGMKVVETVTGVVSETDTVATGTTNQQSTAAPTTNSLAVTTVMSTTSQNQATTTTPVIISNTPKVLPKPSVDLKKVTAPRIVPVEVEEFVIDWVKKNYEACPSNAIEQAIVYRHFAASMHAYGRKQGLNPVLLSNCVRRVFGTGVGPSRRPVEDGSEKWHYSGIKRRDGVVMPSVTDKRNQSQINTTKQLIPTPIISASSIPLRVTTSTSVSSPVSGDVASSNPPQGSILKAQLSAPLRNSPSPVRGNPHQGIVGCNVAPPTPFPPYSSSPILMSPQTIPRTDNSSLIKSLLANKVTTTTTSSSLVGSKPIMIQPTRQLPPYQTHQPIQQPKIETQYQNVQGQSLHLHHSLPRSQVHALSKGPLGPQGLVGGPSQSLRVLTTQDQPANLQTHCGAGQVSKNIQKNTVDIIPTANESANRTIFNGLLNEVTGTMKPEPQTSIDSKKITSFEGILQNGIKDEKEEISMPFERKNILADLLEKTVGGDVLNGVVEKDLRITEKGIQVITHSPYSRVNGPSNGQVEASGCGIKRQMTSDVQGSPLKRMTIDDPRLASDSRITLYVSQNGNDGEVLSQGHQVILNQGQQGRMGNDTSLLGGQVVNSQAVVTSQGQMIIQRPAPQGSVIVHQSPQIISQNSTGQLISTSRGPQVIAHTSQNQSGQLITSVSQSHVIPSHGTQMITTSSGQVLQYTTGQPGQKVYLHGGQLGQVLGGQMILPQGSGQNFIVQGGTGLPGQVIMQSVAASNQNQVIVQGTNGHNQVLVQSAGNQGQVLLPSNNSQGQFVMSGTSQGQLVNSCSPGQVVVTTAGGQTMFLTSSQGQQVMVGGQTGQVVMSGNSQGQMLVQSGPMGNTVFLAPQQGGSGPQKTLIILPNQKMVVSSSNQPQSGQVVIPRQVMQVVTSSNSLPVISSPIRTIKSTSSFSETTSSYSPNTVSVQVHTGVAPPPSGPTATPVTPSGTNSGNVPHIPAPQVLSSGVAPRRPKYGGLQFLCEWRGCNIIFSTPGQVYHHACKVHCPAHITELVCQWAGCDNMVRKRFSLMTHIHDRHCNEQLLQVLALRRQQISTSGKTDIPIPQTPPPHPGYAPNAAFHAIKRHALEVITQRDAVEKEGPVTKSIRLTAALILRNLVIYSNSGKKLLKGYESDLANVAISSMESSRTVGQILYDIHLPDHQAL